MWTNQPSACYRLNQIYWSEKIGAYSNNLSNEKKTLSQSQPMTQSTLYRGHKKCGDVKVTTINGWFLIHWTVFFLGHLKFNSILYGKKKTNRYFFSNEKKCFSFHNWQKLIDFSRTHIEITVLFITFWYWLWNRKDFV